jgi:hypothetical protein
MPLKTNSSAYIANAKHSVFIDFVADYCIIIIKEFAII